MVPAARGAGGRARAHRAVDGHLPGLARRRRGGRDADPRRLDALSLLGGFRVRARWASSARRATIPPGMGLGDVWNRTLVYFGIAEDEEWDDDVIRHQRGGRARLPPTRTRQRPSATPAARAGRLVGRGQRLRTGVVRGGGAPQRSSSSARVSAASRPTRSQVRVHLVLPRSFNDAQQIADRFKDSVPVILNLQSADTELSKRLIDFASGLTYALDGSMQRVADKVFLLTPRNVEVSAEERARALDPAAASSTRPDAPATGPAGRARSPTSEQSAPGSPGPSPSLPGTLSATPNVRLAGTHGLDLTQRKAPPAESLAVGDAASALVLADTATSVQRFVDVFVGVYVLLDPRLRSHVVDPGRRVSPTLERVHQFLYDVCEPYLRLFRRVHPAARPARPLADRRRLRRCTSLERLVNALIDRRALEQGGHEMATDTGRGEAPRAQSRPPRLPPLERRSRRSKRSPTASRRSGASAPSSASGSGARGGGRAPRRARDAASLDARLGGARRAGHEGAGPPRGRA